MILTAEELFVLFVYRKDVFSEQQKSGAYFPVKRELKVEDIQEHLDGIKTIGVYCLEKDNTVKWACVDMDGDKTLTPEQNKTILYPEALLIYNLFPDFSRVLEWSGRKGFHIWILFENSVQAAYAQALVKARLNRVEISKHEVFPKQVTLSAARLYGNLVKLPNAIHKVTNIRSDIIKIELLR